jgi:hypothetical protein
MARSTRGDAWTQTSARVIAKPKVHDEIVKLHTLGASGWTEIRRGGTRQIVERVTPQAFGILQGP